MIAAQTSRVGIFVLGFLVAGYVSYTALQKNAREEILQHARLMMEAALSARNYTTTQVAPLLATQMKYAFLPQSVPAYAASEQFGKLRKKHPDYAYKASVPIERATRTFTAFMGSLAVAGYFQDPDGHLWEIAFNPEMPAPE